MAPLLGADIPTPGGSGSQPAVSGPDVSHIVCLRSEIQVVRAHAGTDVAVVKDVAAGWDRSVVQFVTQPVRTELLSLVSTIPVPIAGMTLSHADPQPAACRQVTQNPCVQPGQGQRCWLLGFPGGIARSIAKSSHATIDQAPSDWPNRATLPADSRDGPVVLTALGRAERTSISLAREDAERRAAPQTAQLHGAVPVTGVNSWWHRNLSFRCPRSRSCKRRGSIRVYQV